MLGDTTDRYTIRICKGTAILSETRTLLQEWQPADTRGDLAQRTLEKDLLGKATAHRVNDIVRKAFAPRFLLPDPWAARHVKRLLAKRPVGDWFGNLCALHAARADAFVRDAVTVLLCRARDEGRLALSVDAVMSFLSRAEEEGKMEAPWSWETKRKVARGLLKMLTEFGFLRRAARGPREIRAFRPEPIAVAYLAFDLHFKGLTDMAVVSHPDWEVWVLDEPAVRAALDDLSRHGLWVFQAAGSVVRITWNVSSMEEAVDVIAGLDI
jgi:hypothetical protein